MRARAQTIVGDVRWTPAYVGLLVYVFVIVTYRLPLGDVAMVVALLGVFLGRERLRFPPLLAWFGLFILWSWYGYTQVLDAIQPLVWERLTTFLKLWLITLVAVNAVRTRGQLRFFMVLFLFAFATHPRTRRDFQLFHRLHGIRTSAVEPQLREPK